MLRVRCAGEPFPSSLRSQAFLADPREFGPYKPRRVAARLSRLSFKHAYDLAPSSRRFLIAATIAGLLTHTI